MKILILVMLCLTSLIIGCGEPANILMNQQTKTAEVVPPAEAEAEAQKKYGAATHTTCGLESQRTCDILADPRNETLADNPLVPYQRRMKTTDPGPLPIPADVLVQQGSIYGMDIRIPARGTDREAIADFYGRDNYMGRKVGKPGDITDIVDYVSESGRMPPRVAIYAFNPHSRTRPSIESGPCHIYRFDGRIIITYFDWTEENVVAQGIHLLPPTVNPNGGLELDWRYYNYRGEYGSMQIPRWYSPLGKLGITTYTGNRKIIESDIIGVENYYALDDKYPGMMRLQVAVDEGQISRGALSIKRPGQVSSVFTFYPADDHGEFRIYTSGGNRREVEPDIFWKVPIPPSWNWWHYIGLAMGVDFITR